jgi:hypothetical protein
MIEAAARLGYESMRNPWLRKNPALSVFLSAANAWIGAVRGYAGNAMKRQLSAATKAAAAPKRKRHRRPF